MTNRERAMNILHFKPADRLPAVHFGYWDTLLEEWAEQGKITKEVAHLPYREVNRELNKILGWDFGWGDDQYGPHTGLSPAFETKVLETLPDGSQRIQNEFGALERIRPGVVSIPAEDGYQLKDRKSFEELYFPKMQFSEDRVNRDFFAAFNEKVYHATDAPVSLWLGSVIGDIRSMITLVGMSYVMYDEDEDLFADIVDTYAEMQCKSVEEVLKTGAKFDYGHFWEDICYKGGPLLSPEIFNELCARHYKRRTDLCRKYGIDIISLDCDGVVGKLLPTWVENGVNVMFPIEVGVWGDQFEEARKIYGEKVLGVGGMDKTAFRKDRAAVDAELERLKRLTSLGGFIPCPDHRLMPGSKFELVQYYVEKVKEIRI